MKKFKLVVPSFLALIFCMLLIAGSTFALFTSTASASISVTSGRVKVDATLDDLKLYSVTSEYNSSYEEAGIIVKTDSDGLFAGTYYYEPQDQTDSSGNKLFKTNGTAKLENNVLTLTNIVPGDRVKINLDINNLSDVNIKYRVVVSVTEGQKLYNELVVKVDNVVLSGALQYSGWHAVQANGVINDLPIEVFMPIATQNNAQNLTTKIKFVVEAVQGNAATDDLLDQINEYLANQATRNITMYDAIQDVKAYGLTVSSTYNADTIKTRKYVWSKITDQFYPKHLVVSEFADEYFEVLDSMPETQSYSIYASNSWNTQIIEGLEVGFDAGEATGITKITYNRENALEGKDVIIRTNSLDTEVTVNAPKDTVHHYGDAKLVSLIAVANNSYHEYGKVAFLEISKGRVALEEESYVSQLHFDYNEEEQKFEEIIIAIDENANMPKLSRDVVETIADEGTLVVEIQDSTNKDEANSEFIWLYQQGLEQQMRVSDNSENAGNVTAVDTSVSSTAKQAAKDIANNLIGGKDYDTVEKDEKGNVVDETLIKEQGIEEEQKTDNIDINTETIENDYLIYVSAKKYELTYHEEILATCTEGGHSDYYSWIDEKNEYQTSSFTVYEKLGHNVISGVCTRCALHFDAKINDNYYLTLGEALTAATKDDLVETLNDINVNEFELDSNINLKISEGTIFTINSGYQMTVYGKLINAGSIQGDEHSLQVLAKVYSTEDVRQYEDGTSWTVKASKRGAYENNGQSSNNLVDWKISLNNGQTWVNDNNNGLTVAVRNDGTQYTASQMTSVFGDLKTNLGNKSIYILCDFELVADTNSYSAAIYAYSSRNVVIYGNGNTIKLVGNIGTSNAFDMVKIGSGSQYEVTMYDLTLDNNKIGTHVIEVMECKNSGNYLKLYNVELKNPFNSWYKGIKFTDKNQAGTFKFYDVKTPSISSPSVINVMVYGSQSIYESIPNSSSKIKIYAGTFSSDPTKFLADGYVATKNASNKWIVSYQE